jgi:N-sulfoglucosamine sulfohydrolase
LKSLPALLVLCCTILVARGAFAADASTQSIQPTTRPNIVWFVADDFSWHDSGPYGSPNAHTPNLDALAKQSLKFDQAFAPSPTCTPSRSAFYTGVYPMRNGAHANHSLIKDGMRTLPQYMHDLGYRVVIAGKTHIGPRESFPFEYLADSNIMPPGKHELLWTDLNTAAVETLLAEHDKATPLCLIVCSHSPHVYWPPNDGYDPAKLKLPPYLVDTPEMRSALCRYFTDVSWMDKQVGEVLDSLAKHGYADNTLFIYTADQGAQFPFAKWNVYDAGIRVPLLIHWPGVTKPGATTSAMVSLIDVLPTIIEAAGGTAPKDIDGRSFLPVLQGKSDHFHDEIYAAHTGDEQMNRSPQRCIRTAQYKFILNLAPGDLYKTHISGANGPDGRTYWNSWVKAAEAGDAKAKQLVDRYQHRPPEELYDVQADPYEMKNLIADPAHAAVVIELREKLKAWRIQQGEDLAKVPMPEDARHGEIIYAK